MANKIDGLAIMYIANMEIHVDNIRPYHTSLMQLSMQHPEELTEEERLQVANETESRKRAIIRQVHALLTGQMICDLPIKGIADIGNTPDAVKIHSSRRSKGH